MHHHGAAVAAPPVHGRGDGGRGVDDQEVACGKEPGQIAEPGVDYAVRRGDEQPHAVPAQPACLRRLAGGEPHEVTAGTARSLAR